MKRLGQLIGPAIGVAGLIWVLHDIHLLVVLKHMTMIRWRYVALAIGLDFSGIFLQGLRWVVILQPAVFIRPYAACRALLIGYFTNLFLPLRVGELVRVYVLAKEGGVDKVVGLASILEERILDGIVLACIITLLVAFHLPLPVWIRKAMMFLVGILIIGALLLFVLGVSGRFLEMSAASGKWHRLLKSSILFFGRFGQGLVELHRPGTLIKAFLLSIPFWFVQGTVIYAMFLAYHLPLPFLAALTVLLVINIGIMIPNTPGNVGTYQFFCVLGLSLYGVDKTVAAGFSIVMFALLTIPILLTGFWVMTQSGFSVAKLRTDTRNMVEALPKRFG